jgi:hypothetical protein
LKRRRLLHVGDRAIMLTIRYVTTAAAATLAVLTASGALAWGNQGHETIGAMAQVLIAGSHAETEVKALLAGDETLSSVSIWADCAKGYCGPMTEEMTAFVKANPKHHDYHFTDVPFQFPHYAKAPVGTQDVDVVQIIRQCISVLRDPTPQNPHGFTKRQALLLLAHFVGDVHQPLHVGTAYVDGQNHFVVPANQAQLDAGKVLATHGDNDLTHGSKDLHAYWDSDLVELAMKKAGAHDPGEFAKYLLGAHKAPAKGSGDARAWPEKWANESLTLAKKVNTPLSVVDRYEAVDRWGAKHPAWHVNWPATYPDTSMVDGENAVAKAGYRLAQVLQAIWP